MAQRLRPGRIARAIATTALVSTAAVMAPAVFAQSYTCFPSCSVIDGRFLAISGSGNDAIAGNEITIGIGLAPNATSLEIGVFDGESSGYWDQSTVALKYYLYADRAGTGSNMTLLDSMSGASMTDNGWYTINRDTATIARADNGNYSYVLKVLMPTGSTGGASNFKVRTNGTITIRSHQSFSIHAAYRTTADATIIYPNLPYYPATDPVNRYNPTTYNGIWNLYLDVPQPSNSLTIWDGDMDHSSALDANIRDTDDQDTPNQIPSWASGQVALADSIRVGSPLDDNSNAANRRSPSVRYDVYFPDNSTVFGNNNPSGSMEWEQFRITTDATLNRDSADAITTAIPAGIYTVRLDGMDMLNVNAWRFFNSVVATGESNVEAIGVNAAGLPVAPIRAIETVNGSISGAVYYDSDTNGTQSAGEPGIPSVTVHLHEIALNGDTISTQTLSNTDGNFTFADLGAGDYIVAVDMNTLHSDVVPTSDPDGTTTANYSRHTITANEPNIYGSFGYRRTRTVGTGTRGYWTNHPDNWPATSLEMGGITYDQTQLLRILKRATKGDKSYSMAAQLIATKLNLLAGANSSCIASYVVAADEWMEDHPLDQGKTPDTVWATGSDTHNTLDDYNNGRMCAPHLD